MMSDRDTETREAYEQSYDTEHAAQLIDTHGQIVTADSIRADITRRHQADIDTKLADWFGHTTELAAYDADAVLELGRHTI